MNYIAFRKKLFSIIDQKTSWGRNELKDVINTLLLEIADEEKDPEKTKRKVTYKKIPPPDFSVEPEETSFEVYFPVKF